MKKIRLIAPAICLVLAGYYVAAGQLEARRIDTALARGPAVSGPPIDQALLMGDVTTLSSPAYAGRRTGSEGSRLAQAYLARRFREAGVIPFGDSYAVPFSFTRTSLKAKLTGKQATTEYPSAVNLIGHIKGSLHPARVMVVSAHYDHLGVREGVTYPGADDNASGVAAMLAVAAYFRDHPPQNTIVFAAFDGEELGKEGAKAFLARPPVPLEQLKLNLNLDMVSRNDSNEIFVAGVGHRPSLRDLVAAPAAGSPLKVMLGHDRPMYLAGAVEDWTDSSDHGPFHAAGIAFLYFGVADHADYHGPGDTADKIKPAFYVQATELIVRTAAHLDSNLDRVR